MSNLRVDNITDELGTGAPEFPNGLTSNGNVGIGTTSPTAGYRLDVRGQAQIGDGGGNADINFNASSTGRFLLSGTERMRIAANGNIGIGNTAPTDKLSVNGNIFAGGVSAAGFVAKAGSPEGGQIMFNNPDDAAAGLLVDVSSADVGRIYQERANSRLQLGQLVGANGTIEFSTSASERMRIAANGNVGIGTTEPGSKLEISLVSAPGSSAFAGGADHLKLFAPAGSGYAEPAIKFQEVGADVGAVIAGKNTSSGAMNIIFANRPGGSGTTALVERMRIDIDGNIQIPAATTENRVIDIGAFRSGNGNSYLDLIGDATYTDFGLRIIRTNGGANATSAIRHRGTGNLELNVQEAGGILLQTTNATRVTVGSTGIVTIANLAGSGSRAVNASATGVLSAASDSRLKEEVPEAPLPGLAEIMQLEPRAYKWLDDIEKRGEDAAVEIGFFANEVKDIIPSAAPMGNDGYYGFYDRAVIAALTKAVQEQQKMIQDLQAAIVEMQP